MKYEIEYLNPTEYKVVFSDGETYILREYFDCDSDDDGGIEVWNDTNTKCLYAVSGVMLLDKDDPDAELHNEKMIEFIEEFNNN
ncbi:MAG: phage portal protein [Firmicutes bacterium]|nr:phage portal protein [Bacillota bacterium]